MDDGYLLLANVLPETVKAFIKHNQVEFFVAAIVVIVGFFRKRIIDLSGNFAAVKIHGAWDTSIQPDNHESDCAQPGEGCETDTPAQLPEPAGTHSVTNQVQLAAESGANRTFKASGQIIGPSGELATIRLDGLWGTNNLANGDRQTGLTEQKKNEEPHERARLHQFFNKVWGETECKNDPSKSFKVRGQIVGEKLALVYRSTDGFYCGAILLHIRNTKLMEGYEVGRDRNTGEIYNKTYTWRRREGRFG